jgi:hypothetical protein
MRTGRARTVIHTVVHSLWNEPTDPPVERALEGAGRDADQPAPGRSSVGAADQRDGPVGTGAGTLTAVVRRRKALSTAITPRGRACRARRV